MSPCCCTKPDERNYFKKCATALWVCHPQRPEFVHLFASAIDTELPIPLSKEPLMLKFERQWMKPDFGSDDRKYQECPMLSVKDQHRKRGLWIV